MKRILIILIICSGVANAQSSKREEILVKENTSPIIKEDLSVSHIYNNTIESQFENDTQCYSETSKVAFFETLLVANNFDIKLNDSNQIAIKTSEQMISKLRNKTLLASNY